MSTNNDLTAALGPVDQALRQLRVAYYVGGSIASSYHGAARSTMDVDIVCELRREHVETFIKLLGDQFYCSSSAIVSAIDRQSCFNLIHLETSFKVDVFILRGRPFDRESMLRAKVGCCPRRQNSQPQSLLRKTSSLPSSNGTSYWRNSERQWNDVSRLVEILGPKLDLDYLTSASLSVGVNELLQRLLGTGS